MQGAELVLLVDAIQSGQAPGTLVRLEGDAITQGAGVISSHGFGVASALGLARTLGYLPARTVFWGLEVGIRPGLEPDAALQSEIGRAVPRLVERVAAEVEGFLLGRG
jgi:hydrogenase maturation protease